MDSLLLLDNGDASSSTLGINIVAVPPPVNKTNQQQQSNKKSGKNKPKNKYEKRRQRAQVARELKLEQEQHQQQHPAQPHQQQQKQQEPSSTRYLQSTDLNLNDDSSPSKSGSKKATQDEETLSVDSNDDNGDTAAVVSKRKLNDLSLVQDHVETIEEAFPDEYCGKHDKMDDHDDENGNSSDDEEDDGDDNNDIEKPHSRSSKHASSNKNMTSLEDEAERAKYLAEFHARPLELDRRAGAGKKMATSRESQHLFRPSSSKSSSDGNNSNDNDDEWSSFGLHPRIVQTLQSSHHFALAKPTLIQHAAIPAFLQNRTNTSKSDKKDEGAGPGRHNLLLHSETGSGKTLAYLLPILQFLAVGPTGENESSSSSRQMDRAKYGTRCLILCPTRELAAQTYGVLDRLCANTFHWLVPGSLLGDESRKSEKARIRKGLAVIVATPGRLLDHLTKTESILLSLKGKLEWLVLDEADRLLDMGLGAQVQQIVQRVRANQPGSGWQKDGVSWRCVLVSATVTPSVEALAKETLLGGDNTWTWIRGAAGDHHDKKMTMSVAVTANDSSSGQAKPLESTTVSTEEESQLLADSTPRQLAQLHVTVSAKLRLAALVAILVQRVQKGERTVVFMSTCASVDYYHALFMAMDCILDSNVSNDDDDDDNNNAGSSTGKGIFGNRCPIYKLHGNVPHGERQQVLRNFLRVSKTKSKKNTQEATATTKKKESAVLLSTDVAARGLNLQDCDWTIQFDPPSEVFDYVHRAGRVARAGHAGHSVLFLLPSERLFLDILKQRGIKNMSALSLTVTLNQAAKICSSLTAKGVERSGGGLAAGRNFNNTDKTTSRMGEAFSSDLQRRLEDCVALDEAKVRADHKEARKLQRKQQSKGSAGSAGSGHDPNSSGGGTPLSQLASKAFLSHIRAYPTREKLVKHIFSARALHLGHVARSFALKEPPKKVASKTKKGMVSPGSKSANALNSDNHTGDSKKRSVALAFQDLEGNSMKKSRQSHGRNGKADNDGVPNVRNARARMMDQAARLQTQGMDSI